MAMHIELYRGIAGLEQLQSDWTNLLAQATRPRFYHAYGWWLAYLRHLESKPGSVCFFLFRDARGPLAILPVKHGIRWWYGLPRREIGFPEHPHMPLNDMLYRADANVAALLSQWRESLRLEHRLGWDMMTFGMMLPESPLSDLAQNSAATMRDDPPCSYIACDMPYEQLFQGLSKNFKTNLKKARNRLGKAAGADYFVAMEPADLERHFEDFLGVEASGWKGAAGSGTAIALHPALKNFYRELIAQFAPQRRVCINFLRAESQIIAACFCLRDDDTLYVLKIAYDETRAKLSPGQLLMERVIRDGADFGKYRYVNLVTDAAWHQDWQPRQFDVGTVRITSSTPIGLLTQLEISARKSVKPLYHRIIARCRQVSSEKSVA